MEELEVGMSVREFYEWVAASSLDAEDEAKARQQQQRTGR